MITLTKEDAFTIVDIISKAQEIVRCKDCKYWDDNYSMCRRYVPNELKDDFNADDFCSKGERRDEID